ncbi:MAG TPA: LysR substrate-binding domain-containing protein [Caulobacterales bacterium]|nr:LysR substrate-binding domain-containing protein [Caulobacterales bacterium]
MPLKAFAALQWVTTSPANGVRRIVEATLARVGATPNIVAEVDSLAVVLAAVADSIGITVLPASALPTGRAFQFVRFADAKRPLLLCRRTTTTQAAAFVCPAAKIRCEEIAAQQGR